jgi:predicted DNA-binding protein
VNPLPKPTKPKQVRSFACPDEVWDRLRAMSRETGVSKSRLVLKAVRRYLNWYERQKLSTGK